MENYRYFKSHILFYRILGDTVEYCQGDDEWTVSDSFGREIIDSPDFWEIKDKNEIQALSME